MMRAGHTSTITITVQLLIAGLLSFVLLSCGSRKPATLTGSPKMPPKTISRIDLLELQAIDISENSTVFSTQDDEIIFLAYLLERQADGMRLLDQKLFRDLTFDSSRMVHDLSFTLAPDTLNRERSVAAFLLVEMDNTGTEDSIFQIYGQALQRFREPVAPRRLTLDTLIGTDDFLGMEFIRFDQPYQEGPQEVIFKGTQLFDRFEYRLHYTLTQFGDDISN